MKPLTPFAYKVLLSMADGQSYGGAHFAYECGAVSTKTKPQGASRFIQGYLHKLQKRGLVKPVFEGNDYQSMYRISKKGMIALACFEKDNG